jgi:hypothetical protein
MNREEYDAKDELWQKYHHRENDPFDDGKGRFYMLRQFLNVAFILLVVIGLFVWFRYSRDLAVYILIGSVGFKFTELTIRLLKI